MPSGAQADDRSHIRWHVDTRNTIRRRREACERRFCPEQNLIQADGIRPHFVGLLAIGIGAYALAKRSIGGRPSLLIRRRFNVTGSTAVLLGVCLIGLGILLLLY
jgi:hypothetical protein